MLQADGHIASLSPAYIIPEHGP